MHETDFLPQFSAQAVIDLEWKAKEIRRSALAVETGNFASCCEFLASMIRSAVHIVLPPNGEIYRHNQGGGVAPTQDECDSFVGIPAPVCCFEYPWTYNDPDGPLMRGSIPSSKRITLVIDHKQLPGADMYGGRVPVQLFSVAWFGPPYGVWSIGTRYIMNVTSPLRVAPANNAGHWAVLTGVVDVITKEQVHPDAINLELLGEMLPDLTAVVQCCHALRAGALFQERRETSSARRWKMDKHGVGGFTYHVLKIPTKATGHQATGTGGSHESPRFHVRRAHIRKLSSGQLTFVRQCFVGDAQAGSVSKHYQLKT